MTTSRLQVSHLLVVIASAGCGSTSSDSPGSGGSAGTSSGGTSAVGGSGGGSGAGATGGVAATGGSGGAGAGGSGGATCNAPCGSPGCPPCAGPALVPAEFEGVAYRIDATEVTNAQYALFLAAAVSPSTQPQNCSWNDSFVPDSSGSGCTGVHYDPDARADYPVVCVDWCDARAYCEWAGKRLCLHPGGQSTQGAVSVEWGAACSAEFTKSFPYGDTYDSSACNGQGSGTGKLAPVGTFPGCEGGVPGLYDMSGNAQEWSGSCETGGADAQCSHVGGAFNSAEGSLKCFGGFTSTPKRSHTTTNLGFRCCADPLP